MAADALPTVIAMVAFAAVGGLVLGAALGARTRLGPPRQAVGPVSAPEADAERALAPFRSLGEIGDLARIGVVRFDDRRRVADANERAHELLGRRSGTLKGLSAIEAFADHRGEEIVRRASHDHISSAELAPHPATRSTVLARAKRVGAETWVVLEDVSELRRLQRIRTEFIDNLSHELRTPLTNVRLLTETLAQDMDGGVAPERLREGIRKIDIETDHLVQMVTELLDLSRIEQGTAPVHLRDVDLGALAESSVERIRLFAERNGVELQTEIPTGLSHVLGDEDRLGQLLVNLLHNAVKFSDGRGNVTVRAAESDGQLVLSVDDQGVGIPSADLERVFERFYKVDKARVRGRGGTGLGLAIARHIAESHGGRIWAESEEGRGSSFRLAIPAAPTG